MWIERHKDCWFNSDDETSTAVVTRNSGSWFILTLLGSIIGEFQTAQEAMYFVDENPDLFPPRFT